MSIRCPSCGSEIPEEFRFCGYCGAAREPIVEPKPPPIVIKEERSSRRLVTVLFADLTNYTRAAEEADPEVIYRSLRSTMEKLAQPIKRLGGRVDRYYGDGFLATFGIPEAHEDDQERALLAALEMQQLMKQLRIEAHQELNWDMQLRIGVNVGPVISGHLDTGSLIDTSVFGHTVNLASRLQSAARPGTVLATETVYRHMRLKFNFNEPVTLHLKGIDQPVAAYELLSRRSTPLPSRGLSGRHTPLIGRDQEVEILLTNLQKMRLARQGSIALITGTAGIGKSRLVDEVVTPLTETITVVYGNCSPFETTSYALLTTILKNLAGISPDDSQKSQRARISNLLSPMGQLGQDIQPTVEDLLFSEAANKILDSDPQLQQQRLITAIRRLFNWLANRRPLLLVLDDVQWADNSTLVTLIHVLGLRHEAPLSIIFISRVSARDTLLSYLRTNTDSLNDLVEIPLHPLTAEDCDRLIDLLLKEIQVPPVLKNTIYERTRGNPLLIEELIRMLLDENVFFETSEGWHLDEGWKEIIQSVPDTVNGLMLSRYDRQPAELKNILDMAAVLGPIFHLPLLAATLQMEENELRPKLNLLETRDFVRRSVGVSTPMYAFRHVLMQEAIYQTILQEERQKLHLRAAECIQKSTADLFIDSPAIIGYHLERGNSPAAKTYLLQAAKQAANRYANEEAINYYQRIEALIDPEEHIQPLTVDIYIELANLYNRTGKSQLALEKLQAAQELISHPSLGNYRLGDMHFRMGCVHSDLGNYDQALSHLATALHAINHNPSSCTIFTETNIDLETGRVMYHQGQMDNAKKRGEQALKLAQAQNDISAIASAYKLLASAHFGYGDFEKAILNAHESLTLRESMDDIWGAASSQSTLGHMYHRVGYWEKAESFLRQAIYVQQEIGDKNNLIGSFINLGLLLLDMGKYSEALDNINQTIELLSRQDQQSFLSSLLHMNRGCIKSKLKEVNPAIKDFEKGLRIAKELNNNVLCAFIYAYIAEAQLLLNNITNASSFIEFAIQELGSSELNEIKAEIWRIRSYIHWKQGKWDQAIQANLEAQKLFQDLGNDYELARRQIELAEIHLAMHAEGNPLDPTILSTVQTALNTFIRLVAKADIPRAEDLLDKIDLILKPPSQVEDSTTQHAVVVARFNILISSAEKSSEELQEKIVLAKRRLVTELKKLSQNQTAYLTTSPTGYAVVLPKRRPEALDRIITRMIDLAMSVIALSVRLNKVYRSRLGFTVKVRVGIANGITSEWIADREQAALFASISQIGRQAEAVAKLAPDFHIFLTGEIPKTVRNNYELETIEHASDRRLTKPVFRLGHAKSKVHLPRPLPRSSKHLIGRQKELSTMKSWIDRCLTKKVGFINYVEAEAGVGKTRLLTEIQKYVGTKCYWLQGKCESFQSAISYWPLIQMLENTEIPDTPEVQKVKSLLGLWPPDEVDDNLIRNLPPDALRREFFGRLRTFLLETSKRKPILLIFEDIHWLDLSSLDLIDFLLPQIYDAPIAIILIARSEMPGPHRALIDKAERVCSNRYTHIQFSNLSPSESRELVLSLLNTQTLPKGLLELLEPYSGHPLSIEEALRYLIEREWLWQVNGSWMLEEGVAPIRHLPTGFRDLLLERLAILDKESLHVLQAAALLGEVFDRTVLSRIILRSDLSSRLSELVERGWLFTTRQDTPLLYRFSHTLTREIIYSTLLRSKLQLLHQRAGEAIEFLYPESIEENLELLAYHFSQSSLHDKSLHYSVRAAEKALSKYSLPESLRYFRIAEEALDNNYRAYPRLYTRILLGIADIHLSLGDPLSAIEALSPLLNERYFKIDLGVQAVCLRMRAEARRQLGEVQSAISDYETALSILEQWREPQLHLPSSLIISREKEHLAAQLGRAESLFDLRQNELAAEIIQQELSHLDRSKYTNETAQALNLLAGIAYRENEIQKATEWTEQCLAIYLSNGNRLGAGSAYINLGLLAEARQDVSTATDYFKLGWDIHQAMGNSEGMATAKNNLGQLELKRGRFKEAIDHLLYAANIARRSELTQLLAQTLSNLGHAHHLLGNISLAMKKLEEARTVCLSYSLNDTLCEVLWKRAECLLSQGKVDAAAESADQALNLAQRLDSHDLECEALRVLSRIARMKNDPSSAFAHAKAAWEGFSDHADPVTRSRFAVELALALTANNFQDEAVQLLRNHVLEQPIIAPPQIQEELRHHFQALKTD